MLVSENMLTGGFALPSFVIFCSPVRYRFCRDGRDPSTGVTDSDISGEDGSELFLGDIALLREMWPDEEDRELKKTLTEANAARELGDPEIVWCIGGSSFEHLGVLLLG